MLKFSVENKKSLALQDLQVGDIFITHFSNNINKYQVMEIRDEIINCYWYDQHKSVDFIRSVEIKVQSAWRDGELLMQDDGCFTEVDSMSEMKFGQIFKFLTNDLFVFLGCDVDKDTYISRNLQTGGIDMWTGSLGSYYVLNDEVNVKFEELED